VTCFNVDPVFAESFKFAKSKGAGDFTIKYMLATFDKHATYGEFYLEFDEKVWEYKLEQSFEAQGAGQVNVMTFENNDGNESASDALLRLHTQADGVTYERGTCQPALHAKLQANLAEMESKKADSKELDDKTQLAIKHSLADIAEKLTSNQNATGQIGAKVGEVHTGITTILEYQKENDELKAKLAHKTREVDRIEGQTAYKTLLIRDLEIEVESLKSREAMLVKERASNKELVSTLQDLNGTLSRQLDAVIQQLEVNRAIQIAARIRAAIRPQAPARGLSAGPSWD
jgi:chromosome segregation ATPase